MNHTNFFEVVFNNNVGLTWSEKISQININEAKNFTVAELKTLQSDALFYCRCVVRVIKINIYFVEPLVIIPNNGRGLFWCPQRLSINFAF